MTDYLVQSRYKGEWWWAASCDFEAAARSEADRLSRSGIMADQLRIVRRDWHEREDGLICGCEKKVTAHIRAGGGKP